jgi:hypothetical protein
MFLLLPQADELNGLLGLGFQTRFSYHRGRPFGLVLDAGLTLAQDSVTKLMLDAQAGGGLAISISEILYIAALARVGADGFGVASLSAEDAAGSYNFPFQTYWGGEVRLGVFDLFTVSGMLAYREDRTERRFELAIPISGAASLRAHYMDFADAKAYGLGVGFFF